MAHRKIMVTISVLVIFSIYPLFKVVGKSFTPVDDRSEYLGYDPDTGRNFARGDYQRDGANRPRHPRPAARAGDADHRRRRLGSRREFRDNDLRQADAQGPAQGIADGDDDQRATSSRIFRPTWRTSVGVQSGKRETGKCNTSSRDPIWTSSLLFSRPCWLMPPTPPVVDTDSTLRTGKPEVRLEIDRPRAADLGVSVLDIANGAQYPDRRPERIHLQRRRRSVRCAWSAQRSSSAAGRKALPKMTVPSVKPRSVGLDEVVASSPAWDLLHQSHRAPAPGDGDGEPAAWRIQAAVIQQLNQQRRNWAWSPATAPDWRAHRRNWAAPATTSRSLSR